MEINKIMTQTLSIALASACLLLQNLSYPLQCTKLYKKEKILGKRVIQYCT